MHNATAMHVVTMSHVSVVTKSHMTVIIVSTYLPMSRVRPLTPNLSLGARGRPVQNLVTIAKLFLGIQWISTLVNNPCVGDVATVLVSS